MSQYTQYENRTGIPLWDTDYYFRFTITIPRDLRKRMADYRLTNQYPKEFWSFVAIEAFERILSPSSQPTAQPQPTADNENVVLDTRYARVSYYAPATRQR